LTTINVTLARMNDALASNVRLLERVLDRMEKTKPADRA
jgi:hypothetical protein